MRGHCFRIQIKPINQSPLESTRMLHLYVFRIREFFLNINHPSSVVDNPCGCSSKSSIATLRSANHHVHCVAIISLIDIITDRWVQSIKTNLHSISCVLQSLCTELLTTTTCVSVFLNLERGKNLNLNEDVFLAGQNLP